MRSATPSSTSRGPRHRRSGTAFGRPPPARMAASNSWLRSLPTASSAPRRAGPSFRGVCRRGGVARDTRRSTPRPRRSVSQARPRAPHDRERPSVVFGLSPVRAPRRKRPLPRRLAEPPPNVDIEAAAAAARYVGSAEHKSYPSSAGPPRLRADATPCPPTLSDMDELTRWLRRAISARQTSGRWEGGFPRYAWLDVEGTVYEARQLGPGSGEYKGYALEAEQRPRGLAT